MTKMISVYVKMEALGFVPSDVRKGRGHLRRGSALFSTSSCKTAHIIDLLTDYASIKADHGQI